MRLLVTVLMLLSTPAWSTIWATGDCTAANGQNIRYMVHDGNGFITYDNSKPYSMFSKRDGNMGVITHIGNSGNMVLAVDLDSGRGYIITQYDNGKKVEHNVFCRLGVVDR